MNREIYNRLVTKIKNLQENSSEITIEENTYEIYRQLWDYMIDSIDKNGLRLTLNTYHDLNGDYIGLNNQKCDIAINLTKLEQLFNEDGIEFKEVITPEKQVLKQIAISFIQLKTIVLDDKKHVKKRVKK